MLVVADTSALLALVGSVGLYDAAGILVEVPSAETDELGAVQTWAWEIPMQSAQRFHVLMRSPADLGWHADRMLY